MSVAGIDIGDQASCIAVARKRGIDVLMNKESKRETPSVISFGAKARLLGTDAVGALSVNPRNTITGVKRLLGKKFADAVVQRDLQRLPFQVLEGPDGGILINVEYLGERVSFTPEQLMAMIIVDLKQIAEADGSPVTDCVISVPTYFLETERAAMLNAAQVAGVNCLRLLNETTATALAYGIYKTDLPEADPVNVVFVDFGHSSLQVSVVAFKKGQLRVLSHAWDRDLGGRDLDEALFDHFVTEFDAKHKLDIRSNPRASFRLRQAAEKLKKVLSANAEAPLNVECLMNDVDVRSHMTRELFEQLAAPVTSRMRNPMEQALKESGLSADDIAGVEVVGSSSRVPAVIAAIRDTFGKEPSRTLNAKEVVARGCALNCAMLSPIFRVRDFEVMDIFPLGVAFSWDKDGQKTEQVLFERGSPIPQAKMLTFFRNNKFELQAYYTPDSPLYDGADRQIGTWVVGPPHPPPGGSDKAKVKVKVRLNLSAMVAVESAVQVDEEEYEEVVKKKPAAAAAEAKGAAMETDAPAANGTKPSRTETADEAMEDVSTADAQAQAQPEAGPAAADGKAEGPAPMETEDKKGDAAAAPAEDTEVVKKKRTRKTDLPIKGNTVGLDQKEVQRLFERECEMALTDRLQEETNDRKNAVEAYVYSMRSKLAGPLEEYATPDERSNLLQRLDATEEWLYEEGEDETKNVYTSKLDELKKGGDPIEARAREAETRGAAAGALRSAAERYMTAAKSKDPKLAHISPDDRETVTAECQKALNWLNEKEGLQKAARKTDEPVLLTADIGKKTDTLARVCEPILSKPAPPPPKKEEKKAEQKAEQKAPEQMETDAPAPAGAAAPEAAGEQAGGEAMEADK